MSRYSAPPAVLRSPRRRRSSVLLAVLLVVGCLTSVGVTSSPAAASVVVNVTMTGDVMNPFDGLTSLREALEAANADNDDTIVNLVPGATYTLSRCSFAPEEKNKLGDLDHTDSHWLMIDGNLGTAVSATITTACADRHLDNISSSALAIRGVTFTRGRAALEPFQNGSPPSNNVGGGSIESMGPVLVVDSAFVDNQAVHTNPPQGSVAATGGAIAANAVWAVRSGFVANRSSDGGAIGNRFDQAGAWYNSIGVIESSRFTDNVADFGGAVLEQNLTVRRSTFLRNKAAGFGGGVFARQLSVSSSAFNRNAAGFTGGDIWASGTPGLASVQGDEYPISITDSTFSAATAMYCGSIDTYWATIRRSSVRGSTALGAGGLCVRGTYLDSAQTPGLLELSDSLIEDNHATAGSGGGIVATAVVSIDRSLIRRNTATLTGGGLDHYSRFNDYPGDLRIDRSQFELNTADTGAGIATDGRTAGYGGAALIRNSSILNNSAATAGGGLALWGGLQLTHATVAFNSAPTGSALADVDPSLGFALRANALSGSCDLLGPAVSLGRNTGTGGNCGLALQSGDLPTQTVLVSGPTFTVGSAAAATWVEASLADWIPAPCATPVDQVGSARPLGAGCTPGAIESRDVDPDPTDPTDPLPDRLTPPSDDASDGGTGSTRAVERAAPDLGPATVPWIRGERPAVTSQVTFGIPGDLLDLLGEGAPAPETRD